MKRGKTFFRMVNNGFLHFLAVSTAQRNAVAVQQNDLPAAHLMHMLQIDKIALMAAAEGRLAKALKQSY